MQIEKNQSDQITHRSDFIPEKNIYIETNFKNNIPSERITKTERGIVTGKETFDQNGSYKSFNSRNSVIETGTYTVKANGEILITPIRKLKSVTFAENTKIHDGKQKYNMES